MKSSSKFQSTLQGGAAAGLLMLALAACQQQAKKQEPAAPAAATPAGLTRMPISINATMVGMISASADFIFAVGNGDRPKNDHDWKQVEYHAYQMILGGQIIQIPGTGQGDAAWVTHPEWKTYSQDLTDIGFKALELAQAKNGDVKSWEAIGDNLVDNCLQCHEKFKPEIPSQGILHEGGKRESEGKSIFD